MKNLNLVLSIAIIILVLPFIAGEINSSSVFIEGSGNVCDFSKQPKAAYIQLYRGSSFGEQWIFYPNKIQTIAVPIYNRDMSACPACSCKISIINPDGSAFATDGVMTNLNGTASYPAQFVQVGEYHASVTCTDSALSGFTNFSFKVGSENNYTWAILLILMGLVALGFIVSDGWFTILGGLGLMIFGVFSITNGLFGFKNQYSLIMSAIILASSSFLTMKSAMEMIYG